MHGGGRLRLRISRDQGTRDPDRAPREGGKEGFSSVNPAECAAAEAQAFLPAMTMLLLEFWQ